MSERYLPHRSWRPWFTEQVRRADLRRKNEVYIRINLKENGRGPREEPLIPSKPGTLRRILGIQA